MKDVMLFFLSLMLTALGLVVAVATGFWWVVWLIAFSDDVCGRSWRYRIIWILEERRETKTAVKSS